MTYLLLLLQQLIASSTHLIAKSVTGAVHPTTVVLLRGVFTCIAFGIWWTLRRRTLKPVQRTDWPLILLLGLINLPVNQLLFIWGVKFTTAPNASLAYALTPVFVVIYLAVGKGASPGWKKWLGVALALAGLQAGFSGWVWVAISASASLILSIVARFACQLVS